MSSRERIVSFEHDLAARSAEFEAERLRAAQPPPLGDVMVGAGTSTTGREGGEFVRTEQGQSGPPTTTALVSTNEVQEETGDPEVNSGQKGKGKVVTTTALVSTNEVQEEDGEPDFNSGQKGKGKVVRRKGMPLYDQWGMPVYDAYGYPVKGDGVSAGQAAWADTYDEEYDYWYLGRLCIQVQARNF